jgi:hypothetical protein
MSESKNIEKTSESSFLAADAKNDKNGMKEKSEEIREENVEEKAEEKAEEKPEEKAEEKASEPKVVPLTKKQPNGAKLVQCMQTIVAMKKKKQEILSKQRKESDEALNKRGVKTDIKPRQLRKAIKRPYIHGPFPNAPPLCIRTKKDLKSTSCFPAYKTMAEIKADEEKAAAEAKVIADKKEQEFRNVVEARHHRIISELYQCNKPSASAAELVDEIKANLVKSMVHLDEDVRTTQTGVPSTSSNTLDLMIFEDDTFKLVPHIPEKNMDIVLSFYEQSDNIVDVEATTVVFPENKINDLLFHAVNVSHKDEFIASFLPQYIIHKQMENNLDAFQSKYSLKKSGGSNSVQIGDYSIYGGTDSVIKNTVMSGIVLPSSLNKPFMPPKKTDFANRGYLTDPGKNIMQNASMDVPVWNSSSKASPYFEDKPSQKNDDEENFEPVATQNEIEGFSFGSHHGWFNGDMNMIGQIEQEKDPKDASKNMVILLNKENAKTISTIVLTDPSDAILETVEKYSEYGWTQLFSVQSKLPVIAEFVRKEFDAANFYNTDALNAMLESTASFVKSSRATAKDEFVVQSEEGAVTEFLKDKYTIDDNVEHKLKASALCDVIIQNDIVKIADSQLTSFKNRLARYLKTLGLRKKRYNDGFYYYGIQKKEAKPHVPLLSAGVGTRQIFGLPNVPNMEDIIQNRDAMFDSSTPVSEDKWIFQQDQLKPGVGKHQPTESIRKYPSIATDDNPYLGDFMPPSNGIVNGSIRGVELTDGAKIRGNEPSAEGAWQNSTISPDKFPIEFPINITPM